MVVVDAMNEAGNVMIRDPWHGSSYETPYEEFTGAWDLQVVFRQ
jgi:hypothetical protein